MAITGPWLERELAGLRVEEVEAGDVGRQQVGGELDAAERAADGAGQGLGQDGLAGARHVLQQHVPPGEEPDQHQLDRAFLAYDDLADPLDDPPPQGEIR